MAKGGYRIGAGRPTKGVRSLSEEVLTESKRFGVTPLEYMLSIVNDPRVDPLRRDRMAIAAAPFIHAKAAGNE